MIEIKSHECLNKKKSSKNLKRLQLNIEIQEIQIV